jgi:hypothetical protein
LRILIRAAPDLKLPYSEKLKNVTISQQNAPLEKYKFLFPLFLPAHECWVVNQFLHILDFRIPKYGSKAWSQAVLRIHDILVLIHAYKYFCLLLFEGTFT